MRKESDWWMMDEGHVAGRREKLTAVQYRAHGGEDREGPRRGVGTGDGCTGNVKATRKALDTVKLGHDPKCWFHRSDSSLEVMWKMICREKPTEGRPGRIWLLSLTWTYRQ